MAAPPPGLKAGLEVHQQLDTREKLFCRCPTRSREPSEKTLEFLRLLRPTAGEAGRVDVAALEESRRARRFRYLGYDTTCLVEYDEEPPRELNREALEVALQAALLLRMEPVEEVHVMRKVVIDGSNTCGFQRTALVATGGYVEAPSGRVGLSTLCLEEDAAAIVGQEGDVVTYSLDRLGIPLAEIATEAQIRTPAQAREVARHIGMVLRSTGRAKRGLGTVRQDVNVSIPGGARVEIKGVQQLDLVEKVVVAEAERQARLLRAGGAVPAETRRALEDGTTEYMRPLPGAARMYPETDVRPAVLDRKFIEALRRNLPELLDVKERRQREALVRKYGLNEELAARALEYPRFAAWVESAPAVPPSGVVRTLPAAETLRPLLERGGVLLTESLPETARAIWNAQERLRPLVPPAEWTQIYQPAIAEFGRILPFLGPGSDDEARAVVERIVREKAGLVRQKGAGAHGPLMGLAMRELHGKADGALVARLLREQIEVLLRAP
ncbi:MAG: Glu-tRNA(Gln) amidotransferase subunit GatE [Halobacteria archaeon]